MTKLSGRNLQSFSGGWALRMPSFVFVFLITLQLTACGSQAPSPLTQKTPPASQSNSLNLTLEQKIGQMILLEFRYWDKNAADALKYSERIKKQMEGIQPGGVVLFAENIKDAPQTKQLIADLQQSSPIPLFIAVDEEGGRVSRLGRIEGLGVTKLPSLRTLGKMGPDKVQKASLELARELRSLGINMNLAPVADLDIAQGNPLGDRAFSSDAQIAAPLVSLMARGFQTGGVSAVLKHFPGLGAATLDPHRGLPLLPFDEKLFENREYVPFRQALQDGADCVMVGHIEFTGTGRPAIPATFDERLITGVLREKWGYQGLIMTDALNMKAITANEAPGESAVKAVLAGADLILIPPSPEDAVNALVRAVQSGRITEKRIDESLSRILKTKKLRFADSLKL